jgi:hypothetical protein
MTGRADPTDMTLPHPRSGRIRYALWTRRMTRDYERGTVYLNRRTRATLERVHHARYGDQAEAVPLYTTIAAVLPDPQDYDNA